MLYQFAASRDYDPSPDLGRIAAPVLASFRDDLINPPELGIVERLMPRVKSGRFVLIPTSDVTRGSRHPHRRCGVETVLRALRSVLGGRAGPRPGS